MMRAFFRTIWIGALSIAMGHMAQAQNLFAPVAQVNDRVITQFEVNQRAEMLRLFRAPGDPQVAALNNLIDERIQLEAAQRAGIALDTAAISAGMEEFAGRANLSADAFIRALGQAGVEVESFRDFVAAGLAWREVIRGRFAGRVSVSEAEIDRAIQQSGTQGGVRVLLSEIILPANTPARQAQAQARAAELQNITSTGAFSDAARRFSASPSKANGGRLEWLPLGNLPPQLRSQVLVLAPGEVTAPLPITNAIALFQLRELQETAAPTPNTTAIEYVALRVPGGQTPQGRANAQSIANRVDTCDDFYGIAKGQPPQILARDTSAMSAIPNDIALELAKLDRHEISTALSRDNGQTLLMLMLCGRTAAAEAGQEVDRTAILNQLRNKRLESYARSYLDELKADATIVRY